VPVAKALSELEQFRAARTPNCPLAPHAQFAVESSLA
jgi:hypothetical protein